MISLGSKDVFSLFETIRSLEGQFRVLPGAMAVQERYLKSFERDYQGVVLRVNRQEEDMPSVHKHESMAGPANTKHEIMISTAWIHRKVCGMNQHGSSQ
jgi:hypothetical protein